MGQRSSRIRCDAKLKHRLARCKCWAMPNGRCRMHGGLSTGAKTEEGKARQIAAMVAGRRAWVARMEAEGKKLPTGPKPKAPQATPVATQPPDPFAALQQSALRALVRFHRMEAS